MRKINVLVFPCGAENSLEIKNSLTNSIHVNLIGASSVDDIGRLYYENYISDIPNIASKDFDRKFKIIIKKHNIDMVFATHDSVIEYLSQKDFGTYIVNGNKESTKICRSKKLTYQLFINKKWIPRTYNKINDDICYPVICKPDAGQGAQDIFKCNNKSELIDSFNKVNNPVIVEYLPNEELTVDCFTDRHKNLLWVQPRTREKVKAGISMKSSFTLLSKEIKKIANDININIIMRGPWFFQIKKDSFGAWKLLEISSRVAGTMVAQRAKGINLPLMTVQDFMEKDLTTIQYDFVNGVHRAIFTKIDINIEFNKIYLDYDDTLIIRNNVSPLVISFVYKMLGLKKEIYLITRHDGNIIKSLESYCINKNLFKEIIHIKNNEPKSKFIDKKKSIFIDNHFLERKEVFDSIKIPVFDVDFLEFF